PRPRRRRARCAGTVRGGPRHGTRYSEALPGGSGSSSPGRAYACIVASDPATSVLLRLTRAVGSILPAISITRRMGSRISACYHSPLCPSTVLWRAARRRRVGTEEETSFEHAPRDHGHTHPRPARGPRRPALHHH